MCPVTIGAGLGAAAGAQFAVGALAIASVAAPVAMGFVTANQQAGIAQANINAQAQQAQIQNDLARQQMILSQQQSYNALKLQNQQQTAQYNLSVQSANNQMLSEWERQGEAVRLANQQAWERHTMDKNSYQKSLEHAKDQNRLSNEAANRQYIKEQSKLSEVRKKAAFNQQSILAKAIGAKGSILASGRTGKSVGLLVKDVERQKGFQLAQSDASVKSAREAAIIGMESGWLNAQSENNIAYSKIDLFPTKPLLSNEPSRPNFINPIGLAIDDPIYST